MLFAGEMLSAASYDHVVISYQQRLDLNVPVPLADFTVTVDGTPHMPVGAAYLLSSLLALFSETGTTFIRLDLPAGVTIGPSTSFSVAYAPGAAPLRNLSLTRAEAQSIAGEIIDFSPFDSFGALVDSGNATDRLMLLFTGQIDLGSIPAPGDFAVSINGSPVGVLAVEPRVPTLGIGIVDLVLASPVEFGDNLDFSYTPGANPFRARNGTEVLGPFSQIGVGLFISPTTASEVAAADDTVSTGTADPPTPADPLITAITTPNPGLVTIDEAPTDPAPAGYTFFGEQVVITAPPASDPSDPLVFVFRIDATLVPIGEDEDSIVVFRNGVPLADCTGLPISSPCVAARDPIGDGDIRITLYTLAASTYNFGVVTSYVFSGFRTPVDGGGVRNLAKPGSAIPVKFGLGGDRGMAIFTAGSPASQRVACDTSAPLDAIEETVTAGSSSLRYDAGTDQYTYAWKTEKAWIGTCRTLLLSFGDGSQHSALFQFK